MAVKIIYQSNLLPLYRCAIMDILFDVLITTQKKINDINFILYAKAKALKNYMEQSIVDHSENFFVFLMDYCYFMQIQNSP
jgi:hypothetical protein